MDAAEEPAVLAQHVELADKKSSFLSSSTSVVPYCS